MRVRILTGQLNIASMIANGIPSAEARILSTAGIVEAELVPASSSTKQLVAVKPTGCSNTWILNPAQYSPAP